MSASPQLNHAQVVSKYNQLEKYAKTLGLELDTTDRFLVFQGTELVDTFYYIPELYAFLSGYDCARQEGPSTLDKKPA